MAKYELELTDQEVQELIIDLSEVPAGPYSRVIEVLRGQIPIPVPVKIGAVVRTEGATDRRLDVGRNTFVRWACDSFTTSPWIEAGNHEEPYRTDSIGRITEVLSPGVDL